MTYKNRNSVFETIITTLLFLGCLIFFSFFYRYHLLFTEQLQIFLLTFSHFISYLSKPAFLARYAGDFLTQFYYINGLGAVIITISLSALWLTVRDLLRKAAGREVHFILPLVPSAFCWIALCRLDYPLSNIIAIIISVICTLIYLSIKPAAVRIIYGIIVTGLLYIIAGSNFYILTAIAILFELSGENGQPGKSERVVFPILMAGAAIVFPLSLRGMYCLTLNQSLTYLSEMTSRPGLVQFLPVISLVAVTAIVLISLKPAAEKPKRKFRDIIQFAVLSAVVVTGLVIEGDFTMEKIMRLDYEATKSQWEKIYILSSKYNLHNNLSAYYTNLALAKLGRLPDELMRHYQPVATGLFIPVNANENFLTITMSNEVYWHLGDVNASQHSALLGMIFSPRAANSRLMKRLVEINIVNGQYAVAEKYIHILEKTMFHRRWAMGMEKFLYNEKECSHTGWILQKRIIIPSRDLLKKGNEYIETLRMLADNHPENRMAVDYLLCYHLLCKDLHSFEYDFDKYYRCTGRKALPETYQEGLMILIARGERKPEDYKTCIFTPSLVKEMREYMDIYVKSNGTGFALREKFGKTYWFYYHFAKMKNE
ncbi:MAG: DUF6057 family protein [Bacteroidales bacterium]|jgi:hypothetical protein